jgi:hypothetical protein
MGIMHQYHVLYIVFGIYTTGERPSPSREKDLKAAQGSLLMKLERPL